MSRNAKITIVNKTHSRWTLTGSNVIHGKFVQNPPAAIAHNESKRFEVDKRSGALYGTEGALTYRLDDRPGVHITIRWSHPLGQAASVYAAASDPPWYSMHSLSPERPTGHDQVVELTVSLNPDAFDPKKWMSALPGKTRLRDIRMPGSHDSASWAITKTSPFALDMENKFMAVEALIEPLAGIVAGWSKTQNTTVAEQLNGGIRYFDLRVSNGVYSSPLAQLLVGGKLAPKMLLGGPVMCHGLASVPPKEVIRQVANFVKNNPKEIILLDYQHFYHMEENAEAFYTTLIRELKEALGGRLIPRDKIANLAQASLDDLWKHGQVIVFFGSGHQVKEVLSPGPGVRFSEKYKNLYMRETCIWDTEEHLYHPWPNVSTPKELKPKLQQLIADSMKPEHKKKLFLLQGICSPTLGMYIGNPLGKIVPNNIEQLGNLTTPEVVSWILNSWPDEKLNIVMCDWVSQSLLTQVCVYQTRLKNS